MNPGMSEANSGNKTTYVLYCQKIGLFKERVPLVAGEEGNVPSGLLATANSNQYPQRVRHQLPESPVDVLQGT